MGVYSQSPYSSPCGWCSYWPTKDGASAVYLLLGARPAPKGPISKLGEAGDADRLASLAELRYTTQLGERRGHEICTI